jgi:SAM-dependent methyltransferase
MREPKNKERKMREEIIHTREGLERLYRAPYLRGPEVPPVRPLLEELALRADDVVVELGSGAGHFTLPIARHFEEEKGKGVVFGCDFSRPLVDDLDKNATAEGVDEHVRAICLADIRPRTLPFDDECVDLVLSVNALQYLANPGPYLREIARVLVPCGGLLIADWREPVSVNDGGSTEKGLTAEQLRVMLEDTGLEFNVGLELTGYSWVVQALRPIVFTI